jgi:hypothetical protein
MIENGFRYAFLPDGEVEGYLADVRTEWERRPVGGAREGEE